MSLVYFIGPKVFRIELLGILAPNLSFTMHAEYVDNEVGALRQHETVDTCVDNARLADNKLQGERKNI